MEGCMRMALIFVSFCLSAAAMVTFVIGVFAAIGYVVRAAGAVLGGIFGAGVRVICASRWLGRVAVKREPLAVARPAQHHTAINVTPVANCWIVENQLHFFIFK